MEGTGRLHCIWLTRVSGGMMGEDGIRNSARCPSKHCENWGANRRYQNGSGGFKSGGMAGYLPEI